MKVGNQEIYKGIYIVTLDKLTNLLKKEGFEVLEGGKDSGYDLFAEKGDDRRIYLIKIGKNRVQTNLIAKMQSVAKEKKAKLFVTYVERPKTYNIEYDGIETLLRNFLSNNLPDELDRLSTHTRVDDVYDVEIQSISVKDEVIKLEGNATLVVELSYGSDKEAYEDVEHECFEFVFRVAISENKIIRNYFKFDVEHFYE